MDFIDQIKELSVQISEQLGYVQKNALYGCPVIQRLSHNSKSQQKEARIGRYIEKQASDLAKYLSMGQPLHCEVERRGLKRCNCV